MNSERKIGIIAIVIDNPKEVQTRLNNLISDFGDIIIGRMGIPYRERNISVLSLVIDATENEINTLTGKLGSLPGVSAKVAIAKR
ncbi:MAG TPA: iron-only hydrogenase system regulator [Bacillota bacterium]|jgi:putative iron-only hydrogenase system regulator|nr:iron-only hydrogenase system regulator [Bacillota bacterium]HOL09699.1 iron-only hydrogenase system regulator [Bacillota bacterium]HPO97288.1 iron-only hydrogenase system regulator [Bacillota bacterium]